MSDVQEPNWQRQLLVGLAALLVVGVVIGAIVAVIAVKAADVTLNSSGPGHHGPIIPSTAGAGSPSTPSHTSSTSGNQPTTPSPTHQTPHRALTLSASPRHVASMGRINLDGRYPGHDGTSLQIQRSFKGGAWQDFPVTVTVHGDHFATYVETGYTGANRFRVLDKASGKTSNAVLVIVK